MKVRRLYDLFALVALSSLTGCASFIDSLFEINDREEHDDYVRKHQKEYESEGYRPGEAERRAEKDYSSTH